MGSSQRRWDNVDVLCFLDGKRQSPPPKARTGERGGGAPFLIARVADGNGSNQLAGSDGELRVGFCELPALTAAVSLGEALLLSVREPLQQVPPCQPGGPWP